MNRRPTPQRAKHVREGLRFVHDLEWQTEKGILAHGLRHDDSLQGEQHDCCPADVWPGNTPDLPCSGLQLPAGEWRAKAAHWSLLHACRSVGHTLRCLSNFSMELTSALILRQETDVVNPIVALNARPALRSSSEKAGSAFSLFAGAVNEKALYCLWPGNSGGVL